MASYATTSVIVVATAANLDIAVMKIEPGNPNLYIMGNMNVIYIPERYKAQRDAYIDSSHQNKVKMELVREVNTLYNLFTRPVEHLMARPLYGRTETSDSICVYESIDMLEATDVFETAFSAMLANVKMFLAGKKSTKNELDVFTASAQAHMPVWARAMAAHARIVSISGGGSDHESSLKSLKSTVIAPICVLRMQVRTGTVML
jgi:hypothetical protein